MTRLYTRLNTSKMTRLIQHLIGLIVGSPKCIPVHAGKRYQQQCAWIVFVPAVVMPWRLKEVTARAGGDKTAR